jgi:TATA element modulatory factor
MLGEQATLESKLESFRARAEEASSSDQGDVQAKLLRQIETLQSQYAAASQNWQGIESSLLSRITNLEKERDDIANRESDVRRKLREATLKTKRTERDLEEAQNRLPDVEKSLIETEEEVQRSTRKIKQLEADLVQARKDMDDQKSQAEKDIVRRIEEEKTKWAASLPPRVESPATLGRKSSGLGFDMSHALHDRSRRSSALPSHDYTPPRQYSIPSLKGYSNSNGAVPETPSIVTDADQDEYFNDIPPTPASQSHAASPRVGVHDLISTSTVGAGPSVQLVERMSANVRRLESEKAVSKDEIVRLTTQRDESRKEVVNLMREVEEKRDIDKKLTELTESHKELEERHRTTLEMLGEKSELVEELRADVADVKAMYRQLADTMK